MRKGLHPRLGGKPPVETPKPTKLQVLLEEKQRYLRIVTDHLTSPQGNALIQKYLDAHHTAAPARELAEDTGLQNELANIAHEHDMRQRNAVQPSPFTMAMLLKPRGLHHTAFATHMDAAARRYFSQQIPAMPSKSEINRIRDERNRQARQQGRKRHH